MTAINLLGQAYTTISPAFSAETCVNFYRENKPADPLTLPPGQGYLVGTPGLKQFCKVNNASQVRGLYEYAGSMYAVIDNGFYYVSPTGTCLILGPLQTNTGIVRMTANFTQIMIVDGSGGYVYDTISTAFSKITDVDFPNNVSTIDFQDGYGLFVEDNSALFGTSSLNDFTVYDPNLISGISGYADTLVTSASTHLEWWLFGNYHTEVWFNAGTIPFPFNRRYGINIDMGCAAKYSVCQADNALFWLGKNRQGNVIAFRSNGYTPNRVSTDAMEGIFGSYTTVSDCITFAQQDRGHTFIWFIFPTANATWVYDVNTGLWHRRSSATTAPSLNAQNESSGRHIANCYAFYNGKHYVGDYQSGTIYEMSLNYLDDAGLPIIRERTMSHITDDLKQLSVKSLQIDIQAGVGTGTGQGVDPTVMLSISKDRGQTWGPQKFTSAGKAGKYKTRVRFNALGSSRYWTFRIQMSDPVIWNLIGATMEVTQGTN